MTTLPLPVDEPTATAFESAPPQERERIEQLLLALLQLSVAPKETRLEAFREAADAAGREAQANGWTDDLDAALLRGDFDHE